MKPKKSKRKGPIKRQHHGLTPLIRAVKSKGVAAIDQRSSLALAAKKFRNELCRDLGGEESLSIQQLKLVDDSVKRSLLLNAIDGWLFAQPSLVDRRHRKLWPIVIERMSVADGMVRCLEKLGLQRVAKAVTLADYLQHQQSGNPAGSNQP